MYIPNPLHLTRLAVRSARGRHRTFRVPESSPRRRELDELWTRAFGDAPPTGLLRDLFPDRWARFHTRGPADAAFDIDAAKTLRGLLDDLPWEGHSDLRMIVEDYGVLDMAGGWSKSVPVDSFAWRKLPVDEDGIAVAYYWASEWPSPQAVNQAFLKIVAEEGYAVFTDKEVTWAFVPYWAGVDIIFPSSQERDEFVNAHRDLLAPHPSDL